MPQAHDILRNNGACTENSKRQCFNWQRTLPNQYEQKRRSLFPWKASSTEVCIKTNKYEYVNEAFVVDDEVFKKDFREWLAKHPNLPMPRKELNDHLRELDERE